MKVSTDVRRLLQASRDVSVPLRGFRHERGLPRLPEGVKEYTFPSPCGVLGMKGESTIRFQPRHRNVSVPLRGFRHESNDTAFGVYVVTLVLFPSPCGVLGMKGKIS